MAQGLAAGQSLQRSGEPRIDPDQGAAIGFVGAMRIAVARGVRQFIELRRAIDQHARHRQFAAEQVNLGQVMAQNRLGMGLDRNFERVRIDVRIAVAVAADPVAHAEERRHRAPEPLFEIGVKRGNIADEGRVVISQRVVDLVAHRKARRAQDACLPELGHARIELRLVFAQIGLGPTGFARGQQVGDSAFGVERAAALHLGRMRRQHGRDIRFRQRLLDALGRDAGGAQPLETIGEAARLGLRLMGCAPAQEMAVLGDIGEMGKISEGADDRGGLRRRQALQQGVQLAAGLGIRPALARDGKPANPFDPLVNPLALLFAHGIAENLAEQPDVLE